MRIILISYSTTFKLIFSVCKDVNKYKLLKRYELSNPTSVEGKWDIRLKTVHKNSPNESDQTISYQWKSILGQLPLLQQATRYNKPEKKCPPNKFAVVLHDVREPLKGLNRRQTWGNIATR